MKTSEGEIINMSTQTESTQTFRCIACNFEQTVPSEAFTASPWHCISPMLAVRK